MPRLDPDPFSPWDSSSEPNISGSAHSQPSPSIPCWWTGRTTKTQKSSSKHSDLTVESLKEFNRRNDADSIDDPYYRGLTDASLVISRRKHSGWSPERESHGTSIASNSTTMSTLFNNIRSSCFKAKGSPDAAALAMMKPGSCPSMTKVTSITDNACVKKDMEERPKEKKQEFNWANKYRPKALKDFVCHREKALMLHGLVSNGHSGHYIFEGPPGVGRRTMVMALLRECFGPGKLESITGRGPISSFQINVRVSPQHIEVNVSELREYLPHVVDQELMKETHSNLLNQKNLQLYDTYPRAIVLYGAEELSLDAQLSLRSLLEGYSGHNIVIFCCSDISKLQHVRSLCTVIQLLPPSTMEIAEVLEFTAKQEVIDLPCQLAKNIAENSKHSLQRAIRSFEATWQSNYPFNENQVIMTGWEEELAKIAKDMIKEQSPKQLYIIREKLIFLRKCNISAEFIFSTLVGELKKHLNDESQSKITALFQEYNANNDGSFVGVNLSNGNEQLRKNVQLFMRIEEFIAKFMSVYKYLNWKSRECVKDLSEQSG